MSSKYLFRGGYVATLDESLGDFPQGAILVEDGIIKEVGRAEDISALGAQIIDTTDGVVIPGMVDTHRHASMSLIRGIAIDEGFYQFLTNLYMRYLPAISVDDMRLSALVGALEALDSGITTIIDTCEAFRSPEHAEAELQGLKDSGIRAFFCFGMAQEQYGEASAGREAWEARLAHVQHLKERESTDLNGLTRVALQLSTPGTVSWDLTAAELKWAKKQELMCCSHSCVVVNSELAKDITIRADHGLLFSDHVYIHCLSMNAQELDLVAQSGGRISIAMENGMSHLGVPPIQACTERGLKPSLSTDGAVAAPDLFSQMKLALHTQRMLDHQKIQQRGEVASTMPYTARDALIWGTRNGAETTGLGDRIGTLTPGKRADIVFLSNQRFLSSSASSLATAVLHSTAADVDTVMVDGKIKKRKGLLIDQDLPSIKARAKEGLHRILSNLSGMPSEMTSKELQQYVSGFEAITRANIAQAYTV